MFNKFSLLGIEFSIFTFLEVQEEDIKKTFLEVEKIYNEYFFVNSYIFTSYVTNSDIQNFSKIYKSNLIFSREENFLNLQIWAIKKSDGYLFKHDDLGVYIENNKGKMLFINALLGNGGGDFKEQTTDIYNQLFKKVDEYGYENDDIIKARNYIQDVLQYYQSFNQIRDNIFEKRLLTSDYPAGTGIDCLLPGNTLHLSNYFLFQSFEPEISVSTISSDLQCEAKRYGPKFSRAKLISSKNDKNSIIFISGTAAVGKNGESLFTNDIDKNIEYTFNSLQNVLSKASMDTNNIVSAFVYIKHKSFYNHFIDFYKKNNYNFPYIYTFCDICRDDFLFEIECIAVKYK